MFKGFKDFNIPIQTDDHSFITIHGVQSGQGPPLLLLHGFPQTHHIWHKIAPELTNTHTVVAIDLRGYGQSSKPPSSASSPGGPHKPYSKSVMASDCIAVLSSLGFSKFDILSHDRGARVAHKLCVNHPERVGRCMLLDICPTLAMYEKTDMKFAWAYWHWFFLVQPEPFPEKLILAGPKVFVEKCFGNGFSGPREFIDDRAMEEYAKQFEDESGVHAMCEDYRAAITVDLAEAREDREKGRRIKCPISVIWGKKGVIESSFDALKEWRAVCDGEVTGQSVDAGHYIAEEVPDELLKHVKEFFI